MTDATASQEVRACTHSGERGISSFDLVTWRLAVLLHNSFYTVGDCVSISFFHKKNRTPFEFLSYLQKGKT